jgi:hypothetical protein
MSPLIPLLAFLLNPQDKPPEMCTISGTVVDALTGQPLNKVDVWVDTNGGGKDEAVATGATDSKGNFSISGLDPGHYFLGGSRNAYLDTYYGAPRPGGGKNAIAPEAGHTVEDVVGFGPDGKTFKEGGWSDTYDLGRFRIPDLEPGKY